jgi:DNA mismatch repair protein MSH6
MQRNKSSDKVGTEYGFAFLDYAALQFWVGSILDDDSCASLGALLVQVDLFSLTLK